MASSGDNGTCTRALNAELVCFLKIAMPVRKIFSTVQYSVTSSDLPSSNFVLKVTYSQLVIYGENI
jgi:hypothetical protein